MTASGTRLLDLVCGPVGPLPETHQRYRLVAHLGSGGQADVYRAVRLCGGVTSAPMTVKVFRVDPRRPLVDELRSWDKGDAALMDLNNRGVPAICRRADGFYGPPPHRPGHPPGFGDSVPYQVYDYLHGVNLREYVADRSGLAPGARRLNAVAALQTLAGVLRALHHPQEPGATPVLHMDVKPSNLMVLATGEVKLIDFTGARYWRPEEITQIAYTPESGGPEAFGGISRVSLAYDVHGFGAVAYFLVTGDYPREPGTARHVAPGDESPPRWSVLRRHPMLERLPALRDHLHQPLADRPGDRPVTRDLTGWVQQLAELVRRSGTPDVGVDWGETEASRVVGRARARPPVAGTETEAFQRIERLERELVELRAAVGSPDDLQTGVPVAAINGFAVTPFGVAGAPVAAGGPVGGAGGPVGGAGGPVGGAGGPVGGAGGPVGSNGGLAGSDGGPVGSAGFGGLSALNGRAGEQPRPPVVAAQVSSPPVSGSPVGSPLSPRSGAPVGPGTAPVSPGAAGGSAVAGVVGGSAVAGAADGSAVAGVAAAGVAGGSAAAGGLSAASGSAGGGGRFGSGPGGSGPGGSADSAPVQIRGRAAVPPPRRVDPTSVGVVDDRPPWPRRPRENPGTLRHGWELSGIGAFFAFICWGIWAASARGHLATPLLAFVLVLAVAAGVFTVTRLVGRMVLVHRLGRTRRSARGAHALAGLFLAAAGVAYLQQTPWVVEFYNWLNSR